MDAKTKRYDALDGIRVIAMLGVLVMHVLANVSYRAELSDLYAYVMYFGRFTSLFMAVSAFSVSCGYFEKIQNEGWESIEKFYKRRYSKILPFFAFITILDVILEFSKETVFEGFANFTLVFGLIPHESITVIGVGWTLGVIFVFYLLYPFFVFLMRNKLRFYLACAVSIIYAFVVNEYFGLGKVDFLYCACYFLGGCYLYLQRDSIQRKLNGLALGTIITILIVVYYLCAFNYTPGVNIVQYILFMLIIAFAIKVSDKKTILSSRGMKYLSSISLEIYLCHMIIFRIIEKANLLRVFDNAIISYSISCVLTFIGSVIFSIVFKRIYETIQMRITKWCKE